ncbi:MAG TPA: glycerophosphodiester phosphodiesterase family protein [Anaerolineae bacterium]|nr:glycerophosphodiester phosphodiesterase family protein [Anaerolineae bacterium]
MNLFLQPRSQPLVIAHRGSSAYAPENTLAAFQLAAEQEADAIELDADLTRDGHVVVMHDATIDRTTDGHGSVADLTLEEIRRADAGTWKSVEFTGGRVPLLEEVFEAVGQQLLINVEIKGMAWRGNGLEAQVAALIEKHDLLDRVILSSFNPLALRRVKQIDSRLACGLLVAPDLPFYLRDAWLAPLIPHLNARHPHHSQVDRAVVERFHAQGLIVNVWTVNQGSVVRAMVKAGVDGIIGDDPVMIRQTLEPPSGVFDLGFTSDSSGGQS